VLHAGLDGKAVCVVDLHMKGARAGALITDSNAFSEHSESSFLSQRNAIALM